jgi:hypothetical protein
MAIDPPWRLDPLRNIVSVGWNGVFVAVQFRSDGTGPTVSSLNPILQLTDIGVSIPIYGNTKTALAQNPKPVFHVETSDHTPARTITIEHYTILVTYHDGHGGSGNAGGDIYVTTIDGVSFWSGNSGGTDHTGGISDAEAFFLSSGWDTFEATLVGTETSNHDPTSSRSITDVGVLIINVSAVHKAMPDKDAKSFLIEFDTGSSTGTFNWRSIVGTFKKVNFNSFPLDASNEPVGWKTPIDTNTQTGSAGKHLRYSIDFTTLKITAS